MITYRPLAFAFASLALVAAAPPAAAQVTDAPPAAPPAAGQPETLAGFEQAMAIGDFADAVRILDVFLAEDWTRAATLRPDPLRSGLVGRLLAEIGSYGEALAYLRYADDPVVPAPQRFAAMIARANAATSYNDRSDAAQALLRADALAASAADRVAATLARARFEAATDSAAALARLRPLTRSTSPQTRYEAQSLSAQLHLLRGDTDAAAAIRPALAALAPVLPTADAAPERLALLDAAIAAARGDADAVASALPDAHADRVLVASNLDTHMPTCGESGLRPDDYVTFVAFGGRKSSTALVAASRPQALAPFIASLSHVVLLSLTRGAGGGTVITLRCQTAPAQAPLAYSSQTKVEWNAARGLFPPMFAAAMGFGSMENLRPLIERLEARDPADPRLVPLRTALMDALTASRTSEAWAEMRRQQPLLWRTVRAIGDAPHIPPEALQELVDRLSAASRLEEPARTRERVALLAHLYQTAPLDFGYLYASQSLRSAPLTRPADRAPLELLIARFPDDDPRRRTLLRLIAVLRSSTGDKQGAAEAAAAGGLPPDSCALIDTPVHMPAGLIRNEDYPARAARSRLSGVTAIEVDLAADGRVVDPRIVVSSPSLVFDDATLARFQTVPHDPPTRNGTPARCRATAYVLEWTPS